MISRRIMKYLRTNSGFTLIEILIAMVILSVALLSMASTTVSVIKGNQVSDRVTEAVTLAQDTIEELRNKNFYLGTNGTLEAADNTATGDDSVLGTDDDPISHELKNSNTGNDAFKPPPSDSDESGIADAFESPDHAYAIDADGNEDRTSIVDSPALTPSSSYLRRAWVIKDDATLNTKTIIVVIGWNEAGFNRYVSISTIIAGTRYSGIPGTI
jgi:prepilin-type N-terminal cleavage/methylation domain-containing protein